MATGWKGLFGLRTIDAPHERCGGQQTERNKGTPQAGDVFTAGMGLEDLWSRPLLYHATFRSACAVRVLTIGGGIR
jgi:hypothetical protein